MITEPGKSRVASLLYLSINDGLDPRINKEIFTLSASFAIDFVGVSRHGQRPFFTDRARRIELISGRSRSALTLCKLWWRVFCLLWRNRYDSVHVINEDLYLVLLPLLLSQQVVLDIFDSSFLKWNVPSWIVRLGQRLSYALPKKIIVTDDERASLMPKYVRDRLVVVPNYPLRYHGEVLTRDSHRMRILYAGSLMDRRGTSLVGKLLAADEKLNVVMAGWIRDERTRVLAQHPRVEWLGTITQHETITQATRCDFILCHYEPSNLNNIYASPNKIFDAIQAGSAIIINPEVRASLFVHEHGLGVVLDAYEPSDMKDIVRQLHEFKATYRPDPALREQFTWEKVTDRLEAAHRVMPAEC